MTTLTQPPPPRTGGRVRAAVAEEASRSRRIGVWLVMVPLAVVAVFFVYPLVDVIRLSLSDFVPPQSDGLDNFRWFFETDSNIRVLVRTLSTAAAITLGTLVLGYPYAYFLTIVGPTARALLLAFVLVPFWTSLIVRNFAWVVLLQPNGPINQMAGFFGLPELHVLGTTTAVVIGGVQILLPFVVLPLYAQLRTIDRSLLAAARSLGAPGWRAFLRVYLPLSVPGILSGALLAFVLGLGFFVTPMLLGSSQEHLLSTLIVTQVNQVFAFGRGSAMAVVLLLVTFALIGLTYLVNRSNLTRHAGTATAPAGDRDGSSRRPVLAAVSGVVAVILVAPTLIVIPMSFTDRKTFAFPPAGWSGRWWEQFFADPTWLYALLNSLLIAGATAVLATILGTVAALGLNRTRLPGSGLINGYFLLPLAVPLVVAAIGVYAVFLQWRLTGSFGGFWIAHTMLALPFVLIPVATAVRGFDRRLEMASASLGASPWSTFRSVVFPIILPSILTGAVFAFATSLDETVVSLFLASPEFRTLPVQILTSATRDVDPTVAAASTVVFGITTLILTALFAIQLRRNRKGVAQ